MFDGETDSLVIAEILAHRHEEFLKRKLYSILKGVGVVVGYDVSDKVFLFHKDVSRPLVYSRELRIFCSEPIFIGEWINVFAIGFSETKNLEKLLCIGDVFEFRTKDVEVGICRKCRRKMMLLENKMCWECNLR
jgi:hypothetical protein